MTCSRFLASSVLLTLHCPHANVLYVYTSRSMPIFSMVALIFIAAAAVYPRVYSKIFPDTTRLGSMHSGFQSYVVPDHGRGGKDETSAWYKLLDNRDPNTPATAQRFRQAPGHFSFLQLGMHWPCSDSMRAKQKRGLLLLLLGEVVHVKGSLSAAEGLNLAQLLMY
jgi:hypothetical protein